jgi:VWFA-related protein
MDFLMRPFSSRCLALLAFGVVPLAARAQQELTSQQPAFTLAAHSNVVVIPTLARSGSGDLVSDLTRTDFRLEDNGIAQKFAVESVDQQQLALVVVMQTGGSAPQQFQNYRTFQQLFSAMLAPSVATAIADPTHPVGLITFDSRVRQIWNFPPRIDGVKASFARPDPGDSGAAILDALNAALAMLEQRPPSFRRVVLLLSQPQDQNSTVAPEQFVKRLAMSNTTVYSITFASAHVAERIDAASESLLLASRAIQQNTASEAALLSGGESVQLKNKTDLIHCLSTLADDFRHGYLLHFSPSRPDPGFHSLLVNLTGRHRRDLRVAARSAYWVPPTTDSK